MGIYRRIIRRNDFRNYIDGNSVNVEASVMATAKECDNVRHELKQLRLCRRKIELLTCLISDRERVLSNAGNAVNIKLSNPHGELIHECERLRLLCDKYDRAIAGLSALDAAMVVSRYFCGKSCSEIGNEIGYCRESVQRHISIAVNRIAEAIK